MSHGMRFIAIYTNIRACVYNNNNILLVLVGSFTHNRHHCWHAHMHCIPKQAKNILYMYMFVAVTKHAVHCVMHLSNIPKFRSNYIDKCEHKYMYNVHLQKGHNMLVLSSLLPLLSMRWMPCSWQTTILYKIIWYYLLLYTLVCIICICSLSICVCVCECVCMRIEMKCADAIVVIAGTLSSD